MAYQNLKVWFDGEILDYEKVKVPVLTHSLQYGSGIFEGIRAYNTEKGPAVFRLKEHIERFLNSAKIYHMDLKYKREELEKAVVDVVRINKLNECYIRPFAFYNDDSIGLSPFGKKVSVFIAAVPFGKYLAMDGGTKCKISTWKRISSETLPIQAKASGNYLNSIIANLEAKYAGYDEAILLGQNGYVAEGAGENIFLVKNNVIITPGPQADILMGVTRDTVMQIANYLGYNVIERNVHKEELYTADEVFFSGTAAEITPIVNIDGIKIGDGNVGNVTKKIRDTYYNIVHGKVKEFEHFLTYVNEKF